MAETTSQVSSYEDDRQHSPDFFFIKNLRTLDILYTTYLPVSTFSYSKSNSYTPQTVLKRSSPFQVYSGSDAVSYNFSFTLNPIVAAEWKLAMNNAQKDKPVPTSIADIYTFFRNLTFPYYVEGGYVKGPMVSVTLGPLLDVQGVITQVSMEFGDDYCFMSGFYNNINRNSSDINYANTGLYPQVINLQKVTINVAMTEVELEPKYLRCNSNVPSVQKDIGLSQVIGQSQKANAERKEEASKSQVNDSLAVYYATYHTKNGNGKNLIKQIKALKEIIKVVKPEIDSYSKLNRSIKVIYADYKSISADFAKELLVKHTNISSITETFDLYILPTCFESLTGKESIEDCVDKVTMRFDSCTPTYKNSSTKEPLSLNCKKTEITRYKVGDEKVFRTAPASGAIKVRGHFYSIGDTSLANEIASGNASTNVKSLLKSADYKVGGS